MKKLNFFIVSVFLFISTYTFGQSIIGGAGVIAGIGNPASISALNYQNPNYEGLVFVDTNTWNVYQYTGLSGGWVEIDYHAAVTLDGASSPTLTLNGQKLKLDLSLMSATELQQLATNITNNSTSKSTLQSGLSIDDLISLTGMAEGSVNLGTFSGGTITDNSTIKSALQQIETALENIPTKKQDVVNTYANLPSVNQQPGDVAFVQDATGDPTVETGAAMYIYDGTDWKKVAELGVIDIVTDLGVTNITTTTLDITSSTGDDATIPAATTTAAGVMTAAQVQAIAALQAASHAAVTVSDGATIDFTLTGQQITAEVKSSSIGASQLSSTGVASGTYGSATAIPIITVDVDGRVTVLDSVSVAPGGDVSVTNEGILGVAAGDGTSSVITSNTSGANGVTVVASTGLSISETTNTNGGTITLTNTAPDQTVSLTGGGITQITGTYPSFTITSTEVDSSVSNEGSLSVATGGANTSVINSNTSGSTGVTINGGTDKGISVTESSSTINIFLGSLPTYDNDVAAGLGGLTTGDWYKASASNTMGMVPGSIRQKTF